MERCIVVSALIKFEDKYFFVKQNKTDGAYPGILHLPGAVWKEMNLLRIVYGGKYMRKLD